MTRALNMLFAIACYAVFFATFLYLIAFVGNFSIVPLTVDHGPTASLATSVIIDVALIALFGVQHSVMARKGFKSAWTKIVPAYVERSLFVLFASVALIILYAFWHPIQSTIWDVGTPALRKALWVIFSVGWLLVLVSTFLMNHFELFGLQQAWLHTSNRAEQAPRMREPSLYRFVRHPMMLGFFLAFWAIPTMSAGHLLLALGMSVYILIALHYEERDLVGMFGADYESYRGRVGMLLPRLRSRA